MDYPTGNILPEEIVRNLKPKVIISKTNIDSTYKVLHNYLEKMDAMKFEEERTSSKTLKDANLYYQIY